MRAAFLGTPAAAIPALSALTEVADVELVLTRPDAARGRSSRLSPPPVKRAAVEWGLEVAQPADDGALIAALAGRDLDVAVVVAYGRILSSAALDTTRVGFVNLHFSLLPRWRGAAPVERAILAGDQVTGVSLMVLDEGLDTGPVIAVVETAMDDSDTGGVLTARLAHLGAGLLSAVLPDYMAGKRGPAPQIAAAATHAGRLSTGEARLDSAADVTTTLRKVRAFNPRPGAWLGLDGERLKVWAASAAGADVPRGSIVAVDGTPVLGVADGAVALDRVQAAGKKAAGGADWLRGRRDGPLIVDGAAP